MNFSNDIDVRYDYFLKNNSRATNQFLRKYLKSKQRGFESPSVTQILNETEKSVRVFSNSWNGDESKLYILKQMFEYHYKQYLTCQILEELTSGPIYYPHTLLFQVQRSKYHALACVCLVVLILSIIPFSYADHNEKKYGGMVTAFEYPKFCVLDDNELIEQSTKDILFYHTKNSISQWNDAIKIYYPNNWRDFDLKIVNSVWSGIDDCNVFIQFSDKYSIEKKGLASLDGKIRVIVIYYKTFFTSSISSNVEFVIKHEIGHILGLSHNDDLKKGLTIMTTTTSGVQYYNQNKISEYDGYEVYKIHGKNGFETKNYSSNVTINYNDNNYKYENNDITSYQYRYELNRNSEEYLNRDWIDYENLEYINFCTPDRSSCLWTPFFTPFDLMSGKYTYDFNNDFWYITPKKTSN